MTSAMFVFLALAAGAAAGKLIAWLAHAIPHRMELAWYQEAQEAAVVDPDDVPFDPAKPARRATAFEYVALSFLCAGLCGAAAWLAPAGQLQAVFFSFFVMGLVLLTWIDARTYLLPDSVVYPLLWIGLIANLNHLLVPLEQAVVGAVAGYLSFWLVAKAFALVRGKEGMGHGDFKLLAAIGAWLGWIVLPWVVIFACFVGLALAMAKAAASKGGRSGPVPFGPSLSIAAAMVGYLELASPGGVAGLLKAFNLA